MEMISVAIPSWAAFNRTSVELKHEYVFPGDFHNIILLIEPVWN